MASSKTLDAETRTFLQETWLPEVRRVVEGRRPMKRVLTLIPLAAILLSVGFVLFLIADGGDFQLWQGIGLGTVIGATSFSIPFLGQLQSCDDTVPKITLAVGLGDRDMLLTAIGELSCYSKFRQHIDLLRDKLPE